jgi:hypothetical protein
MWNFVIAIFTVLLWWTAWGQLKKLNRTSSADFIIKFKQDLFTEQHRAIFRCIEDGALQYNGKSFKITDPSSAEGGRDMSVYDMDDYLGHFEDLGLLEQEKIVSIEMVYELFSFYIEASWENPEIARYVNDERKRDGGEDIYDKFQYIHGRCKKFGESKRKTS